jgi:hypothetical protein
MQPRNEKFFALFSRADSKPTTLPRACAALPGPAPPLASLSWKTRWLTANSDPNG